MSPSMRDDSALDLYLKELKSYPVLSREEEHNLALRNAKGDPKARELLIKHNMRFVVNIARRYYDGKLPLEDLISAGNEGLIRAAQDFDPERGTKFISYAVGLLVPLLYFFLIIQVVTVVLMIPIFINGIRGREAAYILLLGKFGVTSSEAIAFSWIAFGMILVQGIAGGIVYALRKD